MSFRLVLISVTLNDFERQNGPNFALFHRIRVRCRRKTVVSFTSVSKYTFDRDHINTISPLIQYYLGKTNTDNSV